MLRMLYLVLGLFLIWVPFGSAPIYIANYKLDNFIGFLLALLLLFVILLLILLRRRVGTRVSPVLLLVSLAYFVVLFFSVVFSSDINYSLGRFCIIFGYAFVALFIPIMFAQKAQALSRLMLLYAAISASVIWLSFAFLGISSWGRMTIPTWYEGQLTYFPQGWGSSADPNILGFGIVLSVIFGCAFLRFDSVKSVLLVGFCVSAAIMTLSRTTFLAMLAGLIVAIVIVSLPQIIKKGSLLVSRTTTLLLGTSFIGAIAFGCLFSGSGGVLGRFLGGYSDRLERIQSVLISWAETEKTILIGVGFDRARDLIDPHNIYLTTLHDSGLAGLVMLLVFMLLIFTYVLSIKVIRLRFFAVWIFLYMAVGGLTYWHTKTFWVAVMFVLILYNYDYYCRGRDTVHTANANDRREPIKDVSLANKKLSGCVIQSLCIWGTGVER